MPRASMQATPKHVLDAMNVISDYLRREDYEQVVIGKNGGASFRITSVFADMQGLYDELSRMQQRGTELVVALESLSLMAAAMDMHDMVAIAEQAVEKATS